jgi:formylglycine-generating enzyme required for sulfatase activity
LAALVESYGDLLADQGFRPLMVEMADQVAEGEPIDEVAALAQQLQKMGFGVGMVDFEVVTVVLGEAEPEPEREELVMTEVETVTVDERGRVIQRQRHEVFYFEEPLIELSSRNPVSLRNRVSKPFAEVMPLRLMAIPSGKFWMGSPESEEGRWSDGREGPRHQVSVEPFFISQFPITQAQWRFVAWERRGEGEIELELEPSYFKGDDLPVEQVSWYEAVEFCQRLSELTGRYYRLPTEAEWEYACRGDTTTPFYFGATVTRDLANYTASITYAQAPEGEYREKTTPVGQFLPNTFGLYDMHGNVREWCLDRWHGNYESGPMDGSAWLTEHEGANRVVRSGSWNCIPRYCRSACRNDLSPGLRSYDFGFRVVCDLQGL